MTTINFCEQEERRRIGDFTIKWISYGYRGHYEVRASKKSGWKKIAEDWVTGNWEDAGDNASDKQEARVAKIEEEQLKAGNEIALIFTPTSNIFSVGMDIFARAIKK